MTSTHPGTPDLTIGGYRLLARIGEGGMGVVHLARSGDGRRVALKVLRPQVVGDEEGRRRLDREVASLRQVHSPHVAEVLDADPWGQMPFIVTRYVPGHSLQEAVRREGSLSGSDLEHVARRLLQAVRDVHSAGVLHRDLKPTNVVMEGRAPILIDFGLARLADDPRLTASGWLLGTPGYLAPEMLFGDEATAATDVHGWAATLVYAATGRSPYGRGHSLGILDRTRRGEVDLRGVPDRLHGLLRAALSPEPLDRPTTDEVLAELDGGPGDLIDPHPTMPWQLVAHEEPATTVLPAAAPTSVAPAMMVVPAVDPAPAAPAPRADLAPPRVIAPAVDQRTAPPPALRRLVAREPMTGWARVRRSLALLAGLVVVVLGFRLAPYLWLATVAAAVLLIRGASLSQEAAWRRRAIRGRRWSDAPVAVVSYPWHVVRGVFGSAFLLVTAAGAAAVGTGLVLLAGSRAPAALLAGGVVLGGALWWGPGSRRLRRPLTGWAGSVARRPLLGWTAVVALVLLAAALGLAFESGGVSWAPDDASPWRGIRELGTLMGGI